MLNKKLNAKLLWMQFEDVLAPRLGLTVKERAVYCYLLRHSLVVGKLRLHFAVMSLAGVYCGFVRQIPKSSFLCSLRRPVGITHDG